MPIVIFDFLISLKLSNEESILDQWILSRLAAAVEASNYGMANYAFQLATTAIFNFWLYDLCDIYLEGSKPVFSQGFFYDVYNVLFFLK